jgi:two-component system OmpR family response regulator
MRRIREIRLRVLVIEDDPALGHGLERFLRDAGFSVDRVSDGVQAVEALLTQNYDLALLDLGLPRLGGLQVLSNIRAKKKTLPVLILTARDTLDDRVTGLNLGADDYLAKPFDLPELEARVRALLRRSKGQAAASIEVGELRLDTVSREVHCKDRLLHLSAREYAVLEKLMNRAGRVVSKAQIVGSLSEWDSDFSESSVEVYVHRLRKRLDGTGVEIKTLRGFGYLLERHDGV